MRYSDFSMGISYGWLGLKCSCKESCCCDLRYFAPPCSPIQVSAPFFHDCLNFDVSCRKFFILSSLLEGIGFNLPLRNGSYCSRFLKFQWMEMCVLLTAWVFSQIKTGAFVKLNKGLMVEQFFTTAMSHMLVGSTAAVQQGTTSSPNTLTGNLMSRESIQTLEPLKIFWCKLRSKNLKWLIF